MNGDKKNVIVKVKLPRCPLCRASVIYCNCGFTTTEDSREILNGKVPAKFGLSKREAQMIEVISYGAKKNKTKGR